jgi:hypothetical protein
VVKEAESLVRQRQSEAQRRDEEGHSSADGEGPDADAVGVSPNGSGGVEEAEGIPLIIMEPRKQINQS